MSIQSHAVFSIVFFRGRQRIQAVSLELVDGAWLATTSPRDEEAENALVRLALVSGDGPLDTSKLNVQLTSR